MLRDFGVNNSQKANFDSFWDVTSKKLEELQPLTINVRRHTKTVDGEVISNISLAISARVLYSQFVKFLFLFI